MIRFKPTEPRCKNVQRFPQKSRKKAKKGNAKNATLAGKSQSCRHVLHVESLFSHLDDHAKTVFRHALQREHDFGQKWVVLYHCYNTAVLLYEVQAAIAHLLFGFHSVASVLPRLLLAPFKTLPHADSVLANFASFGVARDTCTQFKQIGICCSTSLLSADPEATPLQYFRHGYQISPTTFANIVDLLKSCGISDLDSHDLASKAQGTIESHFESSLRGHMLQIFMRREFVDYWAYPSLPYGVPDPARSSLSVCTGGMDRCIAGQARVVAHPCAFMLPSCMQLFSYSSDPAFHASRQALQAKLALLFEPVLKSKEVFIEHIFDRTLPPKTWFEAIRKA
jgi:hypothetical protein